MNKKAIQSTAICFWSEVDQSFIVQSPLMGSILGAGDSRVEAMKEFKAILSDAYEAYLEGRMPADRVGRPAKNRAALNTDVLPDTKYRIRQLANEFDCSQGETIDFLLAHYEKSMPAPLATSIKNTPSLDQHEYSDSKLKSPAKSVGEPTLSNYGKPQHDTTATSNSVQELKIRVEKIEKQLANLRAKSKPQSTRRK